MRLVIRKVLQMSGLEEARFFEAEHGEEALGVVGEHPIDLILTDINMPVMTGLELLRRLKEDETQRSIPVIVISTEGSSERQEEALELGAAGYLQKPFQPEEVRSLLEQKLGWTDERD
ncbi:MAG: response regulator [Deltaproteobacteria bacterium]|nr:response regulator [Deltaproteobacteria bacterium]